MEKEVKRTDSLVRYLYLSRQFYRELKIYRLEQVGDMEKLSLLDLLYFKTITISRLRKVVEFMQQNGLKFREPND